MFCFGLLWAVWAETVSVARQRVAQVMLILRSQLSSCRADPIKSEDTYSIDPKAVLVKNRMTPRQTASAMWHETH